MRTDKSVGRVVGGLLLAQLVVLTVGFTVLKPAVVTDYLPVAAGAAGGVKAAVLLLLTATLIALAISVIVYPVIRARSVRMAVALAAVSIILVVTQIVDNVHIYSMLSSSERYLADGGANADLYNLLASEVRATRVAAHFAVLLAIDVWFLMFYAVLFRFKLVPRIVAGIAFAAVLLHTIGIPMSFYIGYPIIWSLAYTMIINYLLVGSWLVVRGFRESSTS